MKPHLRYLRYVLLHKLYVLLAGVAIQRVRGRVYAFPWWRWFPWLARLLWHDASKFRPSEWRPYVAKFYGDLRWREQAEIDRLKAVARDAGAPGVNVEHLIATACNNVKAEVNRAFDRAWLSHQHRNPHHWQHHILREDSGATKALLFPSVLADEMLADWLGAGTKVLRWPTLAECVGETIVWYAANRPKIILRSPAQQRIEETLHLLASHYGLVDMAEQVDMERRARESIVIPGR